MDVTEPARTEPLLSGRYRLGECIGQGGMARVHRGEDLILERDVAIKLMHHDQQSAETSARARSEMAALAALNHPALVTLLDAQLVPGAPEFLVMELVEGPTLRDVLNDGALPASVVAHLAVELADGLRVVHNAGVVHCDIKPSNVLLVASDLPGRRYHPKLADFGIACLAKNDRVTTSGVVVGTPAYLAPEQARGEAPAPPADIYALGLVLLEALTGRLPTWDDTAVAPLVARQHAAPSIPESVPPGWTRLIARMTDPSPDERPTAREVVAAACELVAIMDAAVPPPVQESPNADVPTSTSEKTLPLPAGTLAHRRPRRRRGVLVGAGFAAALLAITAGMWVGIGEAAQPEAGRTLVSIVPRDVMAPEPADEASTAVLVDDPALTDGMDSEAAPEESSQNSSANRADVAKERSANAEQKASENAQKQADKKASDKGKGKP